MRDNRFTITLLITPIALSLLVAAVTQITSQAADAPAALVKFTDVIAAAGISLHAERRAYRQEMAA